MPTYAPIDPRLSTIDPQALNNGILSAFNVATEDEKLKAFKLQNDELNQLREDRIAAAHADLKNKMGSSLAAMQVRPGATAITLGNQTHDLALQPGVLALDTRQQANDIGQQPTKLAMSNADLTQRAALQPQALQTTANEQQVAAELAAQKVDQLDPVLATNAAQTELARVQAEQALADQPQNHDLQLRLQNAKVAESEAKTRLDDANAKLATQHGDYFAHRASLPPTVRDQTATQLRALESSITTELKRPLANGMSVAEYAAKVHERPSFLSEAVHAIFGGVPAGPDHDEEGDKALISIHELEQQKQDVLLEAAAMRQNARSAREAQKPAAFAPVVYPPAAPSQSIYDTQAQPADIPHYTLAQTSRLPVDLQDAWSELQDNPNDPSGPKLVAIIDNYLKNLPPENP